MESFEIEGDRLGLRVCGNKGNAAGEDCEEQSGQEFHGNLSQHFNTAKSTSHKLRIPGRVYRGGWKEV